MIKNNKFQQLPLGAISPQGYLLTQMNLQANNITGNMELYPEYSLSSGWLGGNGEKWERGPYYVRGLVALAYSLNNQQLIQKAKKWIEWSLNSQKSNGDFGANKEMWCKMPMLDAIRDYYEAELYLGNEDKRVLPFFNNYFKYQLSWIKHNRLKSWAKARGADNVEVILWYYDKLISNGYKSNEIQWLIDLSNKLLQSTQDWEKEMSKSGKVRYHVVNTTQGFKQPFIKYRLNGDEKCIGSFKQGIKSIGNDHGRIDNLPNADEAARDNLPIRGTETCAVVEGINSLGIAGNISGDRFCFDLMESYAYNNLPNCTDYDLTGYCYYQLENQVLATHGTHGFINDHGDSSAIGIGGYECCFSNFHMGYPKFIQNMWALDGDVIVANAYGENQLKITLNDNPIAITTKTLYPYSDKLKFIYNGDNVTLKIKFRVPSYSKVVLINNKNVQINDGYAYFEKEVKNDEIISVEFESKAEILDWHCNSKYIKKGIVLYCNPIKESWREIKDYSMRGVKYSPKGNSKNWEIYPDEKWNYSFNNQDLVVDDNKNYNSLLPISPTNYPNSIKLKMNEVKGWSYNNNVADTYHGEYSNQTYTKTLIPTAFSRLKISVFPKEDKSTKSCVLYNRQIIEKVNNNCKKFKTYYCEYKQAYGVAQLKYKTKPLEKHYIVYGNASNSYTKITKEVDFNKHTSVGIYIYAKAIKEDKMTLCIDDDTKTIYARVVGTTLSKITSLSQEIIINKKQ